MSNNILNVLANPPKSIVLDKVRTLLKEQSLLESRKKRLLRPPEKRGKKFTLTNKEIQVVHVATCHLNMWLLDVEKDYPEIEALYHSLKSVSWTFFPTWDREIEYAQNNLNKLSDKLPPEKVNFKIPVGSFFTEIVDTDENIIDITEPSLKLINIRKNITDKGVVEWCLQRKNFIGSDTVFTAKVKYIQPTINPLTFGLSLIMLLAESSNIDEKLRNKWLREANAIYFDVEKEIGVDDYSLKNSAILASLYTRNM